MGRTWMAAAAVTVAMALPAPAFDIGAMTEDEQAAFETAVRDYLLANPGLLREWIDALQTTEADAEAAADSALVTANAEAIFEDDHSWVGGNPDGDVILVEFMDYRCSYCRRAHPEVKTLVETDGNIRKIVKEFPILGDESVEASRFAIAVLQVAGDDAYQTISDTFMAHRGDFTREAMSRLAEAEGLDADAIVARMDSPEVSEVLQKNYALAQAMSITGTPTFVVGEQMLRGYLPLESMMAVVDEERG